MVQVVEKLQPWLAAIERRPHAGPRWLQDLRDRGATRFAALGFPTVRDEEWRFTNISPIANAEFVPATEAAPVTEHALRGVVYSDAPNRVVVLNGRFAAKLSHVNRLPNGVRVGSLAAAVTEHADVVSRYLGQLAEFGTKAFTALNTALAVDGLYVHIPDGVVLDDPLHLVFVTTPNGSSQPIMSNVRTLVVVGDRSQVRIVETYVGPDGGAYFTNAVTEVFAGEGSVVDHYKVQQESPEAFHVATLQATLGRSANFSSHSISFGGALVRNDAGAVLSEGTEATLNGLYIVNGTQHIDNHTVIDHAKPNANSHEMYKGILDGKSSAVFNGRIIVRKDAQKTDSKQTNKNLVLSDESVITTKPELQIHADDVRCTHGATIGQLDAEALFYLQSRGIGRNDARNLLTYAFAQDIVDRIKVGSLRGRLERMLFEKFHEHSK